MSMKKGYQRGLVIGTGFISLNVRSLKEGSSKGDFILWNLGGYLFC
jgi:hypothetical protein